MNKLTTEHENVPHQDSGPELLAGTDHPNDPLKIIVLDCPYDILGQPQAQRLFSQFAAAKIEGYSAEYPQDTLPFGVYDFIATTILIGSARDDDFKALAVFKTISVERCNRFGVPFEALAMFGGNGGSPYRDAIQNVLDSAPDGGRDVAYSSSWTLLPEARRHTKLRHTIRDIALASFYYHHQDSRASTILVVGVPRLKTAQLFKYSGFEYLELNGQPLPSFKCEFLKGEEVTAFRFTQWRHHFVERARKFRHLWEARQVFSRKTPERSHALMDRRA